MQRKEINILRKIVYQFGFIYKKKTLLSYKDISNDHDVGIARRFFLDLIYFHMSYKLGQK